MQTKKVFQVGLTALVAGLLLFPVSSGFAQRGGPGGPGGGGRGGPGPCGMNFIERFDEDGDGKISQAEFPTPEKRFARLDANQDGFIEKSEMPGRMGRHHGRGWGNLIEDFDKDGDGKLSKDELPGPADRFSRLDANEDGFIDPTEAHRGGPRQGKGWGMLIEDFDKDGDGTLSKDEFPNPENCFSRLDTNNDGHLDSSEMPTGRSRHGRGWRNQN
jgi:Ca2+-binding EF-hand superfamily protein